MIEFDYKIVRDEGDEKTTYVPSIPTKLQDLSFIEGPNSSGKSTLLHIIALGLFGLKNKNINDSLQRKLKDLATSDHQEVTFSFSIKNERNNLRIDSSKKSPHSQELTVYETTDGRRTLLTAESFERKYNLIYDIPDDPLERLDELTKELRDRQARVGQNVGELKIQLRDLIKEVQNSRDPKKLEEFVRQLKELNLQINKLRADQVNLESDRLLLRQYYSSRYFVEYQTQLLEASGKYGALQQAHVIQEKKGRSIKRKEKKLTIEAGSLFTSISATFTELLVSLKAMNLRTKNDYLAVWKDQAFVNLLVDPEKNSILFRGLQEFRAKIRDLDKSLGNDGRLDEASFLDDLINLLQHYNGVKTTLPGTDNKTVPEFIAALEKRYRECKDVKVLHDKYLGGLAKLDELETNSQKFMNSYLPELIAVQAESKTLDNDSEYSMQQEMNVLDVTMASVRKKILYFRDEMILSGVRESDAETIVTQILSKKHLRPYSNFNEHELEAKLAELADEIDKGGKKLKELEYMQSRLELEIHRLEQQEPHKYQQRLDELQKMFAQVQILEQKLLREYDENLKMLLNKNIRKPEISKNQKAYFSAVSVYLGRKVKSIRHVDNEYPVDMIDLVDRKILTQSGKTIMLTDLGTGQSQSAYLRGLLNSNDNRKIIALIDEVAMMDNKSMKPINELLKKKYIDGSLVAGIIVQKGENLTVTPML